MMKKGQYACSLFAETNKILVKKGDPTSGKLLFGSFCETILTRMFKVYPRIYKDDIFVVFQYLEDNYLFMYLITYQFFVHFFPAKRSLC